jgi:hypothetical protein
MFGIDKTIKEIALDEAINSTDYSVINGRWHMNNRQFKELSFYEKSALAERIKSN